MLDGWKTPEGMTWNIPPQTATWAASRLCSTNDAEEFALRIVSVEIEGE